MTATIDRPEAENAEPELEPLLLGASLHPEGGEMRPEPEGEGEEARVVVPLRPILAAALACSSAAKLTRRLI
jgi:hypothetical protein